MQVMDQELAARCLDGGEHRASIGLRWLNSPMCTLRPNGYGAVQCRSRQQEWHRHRAGASRPDAKAWLDYPAMGFGMLKTVWPSGLRRWLKAPFRKGMGSNPTAVNEVTCGFLPLYIQQLYQLKLHKSS